MPKSLTKKMEKKLMAAGRDYAADALSEGREGFEDAASDIAAGFVFMQKITPNQKEVAADLIYEGMLKEQKRRNGNE